MTSIASPVSPAHPGQELAAVGGLAARLGGDGAQAAHRPAREPGGAGMERRHGPVHRHLAEPAGVMQPLAEPHDAAEAVDHPKPVAGRRADQQAAIVGAEVERRESGPGLARRCGAVGVIAHPSILSLRHMGIMAPGAAPAARPIQREQAAR